MTVQCVQVLTMLHIVTTKIGFVLSRFQVHVSFIS